MYNIYKYLILFLIIIVTTSFQTSKTTEEIFNVRNLTLKKGDVTTFILDDLKKGDAIVPHLDLAVGKSRLTMKIGKGEGNGKTYKSNAVFTVPADGVYSIEVVSDKKVVVDFKIDRTYVSASGATVPLVRVRNMYVGRDGKTEVQPIINYSFPKGTQLGMKGSGVEINHLQDLKFYTGGATVVYESYSTQSFRLFWKLTKQTDRIQDLRKISELSFSKVNPVKSSGGGGGGSSTVAKPAESTTSDPFNIDFPEIPDNSGVIADAMEKARIQDSIQTLKQDSTTAKLLEVMEKMLGEDPPEMVGFSNDTFEVVEVKPRMALNANNRSCMTINTEGGQALVYWVGVGDIAKQTFLEKQQRVLRSKGEYDNWLQAHYSVVKNPEFATRKLPFPTIQSEQVEYAIVDDANRERFEEGLPYTPYRPNFTEASTSAHSGYAGNVTASTLYLCACNENRISPVKVYLMYNTFLVLSEEVE